ncbi:hypothetical protein LXL04_030796 [Taraxacum kok-saghyz]
MPNEVHEAPPPPQWATQVHTWSQAHDPIPLFNPSRGRLSVTHGTPADRALPTVVSQVSYLGEQHQSILDRLTCLERDRSQAVLNANRLLQELRMERPPGSQKYWK